MNTERMRIKDVFRPERPDAAHEYHQDTVRVALLQMSPRDIAVDLLSPHSLEGLLSDSPASEPNVEDGADKKLNIPSFEITTMVWEIKANAKNVVNPEQVIMPGGGGRKVNPDKPIPAKLLIKAALEESSQEVHLIAHNARVIPDASYTYSFLHPRLPDTKKPGRLKNTTHLIVARTAPHDTVKYFDPADKLQGVVAFFPSEISSLFANSGHYNEYGHFFPIVDSLSRDKEHKPSDVTNHTDEQPFKTATEAQIYIYEAIVQRKIVERLVQIAHDTRGRTEKRVLAYLRSPEPKNKLAAIADLQKAHAIMSRIENAYEQEEQAPVRHIDPVTYQKLVDAGVSPRRLKQRMKLIDDLNEAIRQVALDITVDCYKDTGPQFPLLLSHVLAQIPEWGQYEYQVISECPELKHIVDTACTVFGVQPTERGWHKKLREHFIRYKESELSDYEHYASQSARWADLFCNPTDGRVWKIGDAKKIGYLSYKVNKYLELQLVPLSRFADAELLNKMKSDALGSATSEIPELSMLLFGSDQYTGDDIEVSERAAGSRKLVHILHMDQVENQRTAKIKTQIKPFREAARSIFGKPDSILKTEEGVFNRHVIGPDILAALCSSVSDIPCTVGPVDLTTIPLPLVFQIREKDEFSQYRKFIERGGLESPDEDMSDSFGFMAALDEKEFALALMRQYPSLSHEKAAGVIDYWSTWATAVILNGFNEHIMTRRYTLKPAIRMYKGRVSTEFADTLPIEDQEMGSASSHATWRWVKYVEELKDTTNIKYQVEWQFFPSIEDMVKKKKDDVLFDLMRQMNHANRRYPPIRVNFGLQDTYDDVMRRYYTVRYEREMLNLPLYKKLLADIYHWIRQYLAEEEVLLYEAKR